MKLNLPIKNLKKFVKMLHVSGCSVATYDSKKMATKNSKVVTATFRDSNLLHWMGEYPMLTLQVFASPQGALHGSINVLSRFTHTTVSLFLSVTCVCVCVCFAAV